jgi:hypothetical protein
MAEDKITHGNTTQYNETYNAVNIELEKIGYLI